MELTADSAKTLIDHTMAQLGDTPDANHLLAACNRLQGMYDLLKVIPSFKASRYHPRMFPDAVAIEEMLVEAIEQVSVMQKHYAEAQGSVQSHQPTSTEGDG